MKKTNQTKKTKESKKNNNKDDNQSQTPAEAMSGEQVERILIELSNTYYWQVIKRYNFLMDYIISDSLRSLDPNKNPTELARNQGILQGLHKMVQETEQEKANKKKGFDERRVPKY